MNNWKRLFEFKKTDVLGLDIGSYAVKMIALRKGDTGYTAIGAGIAEIAPGEDDNHRRTNTIQAIRKCFESARIKTKLAVCGVNGQEVAVRDFEFPALLPEEITAAVSLEASQVCPFSADDSAVDYHLLPDDDDKTSGVLVAATNTLIKGKTQIAKEAKLKCIMMGVDGLALLNCYKGLEDGPNDSHVHRAVAILNVGASYTTLAVMDNNGRPFIRDMTYAGNDVMAQIAAETNTSVETVREILYGDPAEVEPGFHGSLEKASQKLIADVAETLRYYTAQSSSSNVGKILVCGGFALAGGFIELLNRRLGAGAVLWNPFDKIPCNGNRRCEDVLSKAGPVMAVAAGLAMRTI